MSDLTIVVGVASAMMTIALFGGPKGYRYMVIALWRSNFKRMLFLSIVGILVSWWLICTLPWVYWVLVVVQLLFMHAHMKVARKVDPTLQRTFRTASRPAHKRVKVTVT